MINKKKIVFGIVIFISITAGVFFWLKYSKLFVRLNELDNNYKKVVLDYKKTGADFENSRKENLELKDKYAKMHKDYQALSLDRDNVLSQAKNLLADKNKFLEMEASSKKLEEDLEALERKEKKLLKENVILKDKIQKLLTEQRELINEKTQTEEELSRERDANPIKSLEKEKAILKKDNLELAGLLKQSQSEIGKLRETASKSKNVSDKSDRESKELREKLNKLNKNYASAVKKNRILEQKVIETPKKFVEIARQNKVLIRQTANMHYNLGVFYMKNKEYSRAVSEFEKSIELTPDDAYAQFNIGYIYAEYLLNRPKAIEHFRQYLRVVKSDDKDVDWVKKYILTWDTYDARRPMD